MVIQKPPGLRVRKVEPQEHSINKMKENGAVR